MRGRLAPGSCQPCRRTCAPTGADTVTTEERDKKQSTEGDEGDFIFRLIFNEIFVLLQGLQQVSCPLYLPYILRTGGQDTEVGRAGSSLLTARLSS